MGVEAEVEQGFRLAHFALGQLRHFVDDGFHQVRGVADGGEADQARTAFQGVHGALQFFDHFALAEIVFQQLAGGLQQFLRFVGEDVHQHRVDVFVEFGRRRHFFHRGFFRRFGGELFLFVGEAFGLRGGGCCRFFARFLPRQFGGFGHFRVGQRLVEVAVDVVEDVRVGLRQVAVAHGVEHEHALPHRADEDAGCLAACFGLAVDDAVNQGFDAVGEVADGVVACHARAAFQGVHVAADGVEAAQLVAVFVPAFGFFLAVGEERHGFVNEGFRQHGVGVRVFDQLAAERGAAVRQGRRFAAAFAAACFAARVEQGVDGLDGLFFVGVFFEIFDEPGALPQDGGAAQADRGAFLFVGEQQLFDGVEQTPDPRRRDLAINTVFDVVNRVDEVVDDGGGVAFVRQLREGVELVHRAQEAGAVAGGAVAAARLAALHGIIQAGMLCQ